MNRVAILRSRADGTAAGRAERRRSMALPSLPPGVRCHRVPASRDHPWSPEEFEMIAPRRSLLCSGLSLSIFLAAGTLAFAQGFKVIHVNTSTEAGTHTLIQNPGDGLFYGVCETGGAHPPNGCVFKMN